MNQTVSRHERWCFNKRVAPVLRARGFPEEEVPDLLELEWEEYRRESKRNPGPGSWPTGITLEEKDFAHAIAEGLREGNRRNWQVLSQLRAPAFPNGFTKRTTSGSRSRN